MRRDSSDKAWQEVKKKVLARDGNSCRLLRVLSLGEAFALQKNAKGLLSKLDPAHYIPVSADPSIMYDENNICMINRYSHSMLDSYKDPITGKPISKEKVQEWWERILKGNSEQYNYLKQKELV